MATILAVKRVYASPVDDDGFRILVDRLWPRGLRSTITGWCCLPPCGSGKARDGAVGRWLRRRSIRDMIPPC